MRPAIVFCALVIIGGCGRVADGTRDALNKGGEIAGTAATEVVEGVATGVEKSWAMDVRLSATLKSRGLSIGKTTAESGAGGMENRLIVYLIADSAFSDTISAVALDQEGVEMGRARTLVHLGKGAADYWEFTFQDRTDLERKSRIDLR